MLKSKKFLLGILLAICGLLIITALSGFTYGTNVFAEASYTLTDVDYTNNDNLINSDGSLANENIRDFANEVKSANPNSKIDKITKVIPIQYLESTEANATYYFNGAEYGFFVVKENDIFDVLLIDFIFEFNDAKHSDLEYKIRVEPILQQSFLRTVINDGDYTWQKYNGNRNKYYVANPRFFTNLQNENSLNYGDSEYKKAEDEGLIITQFRTNYGKVSYADETDLVNTITEFAANQLFDVTCDMLDSLTFGVGGKIAGIIKDYVEFGVDLYETGKETVVFADNENNIKTEMSKTSQKADTHLDSYSRSVGFAPIDNLVLSDANDSYAEFIVVLNDANYKSRLTQFCDFDIVYRNGNFSSMQNVNTDNNETFNFNIQRLLFEDQAPKCEINGEEFVECSKILYLLPYGKQMIILKPTYTANYELSIPDELAFKGYNFNYDKINGVYSFKLDKDNIYTIEIINETFKTFERAQLKCRISDYNGEDFNISSKNHMLLPFNTSLSGLNKLYVNSKSCEISLLNEHFSILKQKNGTLYYDFSSQQQYFILIENNSSANLNLKLMVESPDSISVDKENSLLLNNEEYFSVTLSDTEYLIEYSYDGNVKFLGFARYEDASEFSDNENKINYIILHSICSREVYLGFEGVGTVNISIRKTSSAYEWEVDDKKYGDFEISDPVRLNTNNELVIRRGTQAKVRLKLGSGYIDNIVSKATSYDGYTYSNYILSIKSNCQLTNDTGSNILGLKIAVEQYCIVDLNIKVINDITSVNFELYSDNDGYGFKYGGISTVATDKLSIEYKMPRISNKSYKAENLSISGGIVYLSDKVENIYNSFNSFEINISKIMIYCDGGIVTVYDSSSLSNSQFLNKINSIECNQYFKSGNGSLSSPYKISCQRHLDNIRKQINSNYILTSDIILKWGDYANWQPISNFYGEFDGNDNKISGLELSRIDNNVGLFAINSGTIKNLRIGIVESFIQNYIDVDVVSKPNYEINIGAIVGLNRGTIENCFAGTQQNYSDVKIDTYFKANVGTICGFNDSNGIVRNCIVRFSKLNIFAGTVGGVVGKNLGTVIGCDVNQLFVSCYNQFPANDNDFSLFYEDGHYGYAGGVCGWNQGGSINSCTLDYDVRICCGALNYTEKNYDFAPEMGVVCGRSTSNPSNCTFNTNTYVGGFYLHTETWTTGALWWKETHTHDQAKYVGVRAVGRIV